MEFIKVFENGDEFKYTEGFWTGDKSLAINGEPAHKLDKKTFRRLDKIDMSTGTQTYTDYTVKGNYLFGVKLISDKGENLVIVKNTWYDWIFIVLAYVSIIFGALFMGAIGGALSALTACAVVFGILSVARSKLHVAAKVTLELLLVLAVNALWCGLYIAVLLLLIAM
ncbi:MAG: hypothetical protein K2O89_07185 [Clostridia bacterium]|nr:hypothetical protein [Clostridia bacterium]